MSRSTTSPAWRAVPGGGSYGDGISAFTNTVIESGQAFFAHATGSTGSVTLTEGSKIGAQSNAVFRPTAPEIGQLITNLYAGSIAAGDLSDVNVVAFSDSYSNAIDVNDVLKFPNEAENLGVARNGQVLWIEGRQAVTTADTIFFNMTNLKKQRYQLEFVPTGLDAGGLTAYLQDKYLGTNTPISLDAENAVPFTVDNNAASSTSDRFKIVFRNATPVPVTFTGIQASQKNAGVQVDWNVTAETSIKEYVVERSTDNNSFSSIGAVAATGNTSYALLDTDPEAGNDYYRIKSIGSAGEVKYSSVVKVTLGAVAASMKTYFVNNGTIALRLTNQPAGKYSIRLLNIAGQELSGASVNHSGGTATYSVSIPNVAKGVYQVEIMASGKVSTQKITLN